MNNDVISRSAVIKDLEMRKELFDQMPSAVSHLITDTIEMCRIIVEMMPALDAVPVVRCKDCRYANSKYSDNFILCDIWGEDIPRDGYCYCGKRMGGEDI